MIARERGIEHTHDKTLSKNVLPFFSFGLPESKQGDRLGTPVPDRLTEAADSD